MRLIFILKISYQFISS